MAVASFFARAPVVTATYSVSRARFLRSWDRFMIPLPFGRGAMIWGEALPPPDSREGIEALTSALQTRLDEICVDADRMTGLAP